ncbi:hypothetical protein A9Q78_05255 [Methylophaga sp. 41_12_T18]|nr:hypothetical protein A9Q78_05255 [Methylophaga sp. 41_12_T18]
MYQIAMAPITGEIIGGARGISTHLTFQNSPDLFLTFILIYLCGSVVFGRMTWDALKNHWVSVKQYRSNANKL